MAALLCESWFIKSFLALYLAISLWRTCGYCPSTGNTDSPAWALRSPWTAVPRRPEVYAPEPESPRWASKFRSFRTCARSPPVSPWSRRERRAKRHEAQRSLCSGSPNDCNPDLRYPQCYRSARDCFPGPKSPGSGRSRIVWVPDWLWMAALVRWPPGFGLRAPWSPCDKPNPLRSRL